jgi:hypothetical protein
LLATGLEKRLAGGDLVDAAKFAHPPYPVDRHHFCSVVQPGIRGDRVLVLGVGQLDRLGLLAEQMMIGVQLSLKLLRPMFCVSRARRSLRS